MRHNDLYLHFLFMRALSSLTQAARPFQARASCGPFVLLIP
jgi:hypothetical protein